MTFSTAIKGALFSAIAFGLGSGSAMADGNYNLYSIGDANPMGTIEIQGDVTLDGVRYASWWVPTMKMMLYVPPEAAYVTLEKNSPINAKQFEGGWVSHKTSAELGSDVCEDPETDHNGTVRPLWGQLVWTVYVDDNDYGFEISLGNCLDPLQPWGQNTDAKG